MLKNYMWEIFEIAKEENSDGDNFTPDVSTAAELFVSGIMGKPTCQYEAVKRLDIPKVRAEWEALSEAEKQDERSDINRIYMRHPDKLAAAFNGGKGDREAFYKIVNG